MGAPKYFKQISDGVRRMWTYFLGPVLSLLPASWRAKLPSAQAINWRRATFLSGVLEVVASLCALVVWYSYSVTHHTQLQLSLALRAHPDIQVVPQLLGLMGFVLVALNVVTWVMAWFGLEGLVRAFGAAFTGEILGTLPLWIIDQSYRLLRRRSQNRRGPPLAPDEVTWVKDGQAEVLRVMSCRPKPTWKNRPSIRIKEEFFQVEKSVPGAGPRPYVYQLRRLKPGEIVRGLEDYDPQAPPQETPEEGILVSIYRALGKK
jgi:hypothetical protein